MLAPSISAAGAQARNVLPCVSHITGATCARQGVREFAMGIAALAPSVDAPH